MSVTKADEKRRITLPKDILEDYGDRFVIIRLADEVILKPLPKDPIAALQEEGKKLGGVGWKQIRQDFEKALNERSRKNRKS